MAKGFLSKASFVSGVQSPRLDGREDLQQYQSGARRIVNGLVQVHGGVARRTGTRFVTSTRTRTQRSLLVSFVAADDAAYLLEIGSNYMRFITSGDGTEDGLGYVTSGGEILELETPWGESDLARLCWDQSVDVMYFVCPGYFPQKLIRTAADAFSLSDVRFSKSRAPLRSLVRSAQVTANAAGSGGKRVLSITGETAADIKQEGLVVGNTFYCEAPTATFDFTDPDFEAHPMSLYGTITAVSQVSATQVDVTVTVNSTTGRIFGGLAVETVIANPSAAGNRGDRQADYATGLFTPHSGPSAADGQGCQFVTFHEGRLGYFGFDAQKDAYSLSVSDDFDNFERSSPDPAALDDQNADKAIYTRLVARKFNAISWAASTDDALIVGTRNNEFRVRGTDDGILTPLGVNSKPATSRGSEYHIPITIDGRTYFIQRGGRRLRLIDYQLSEDGFAAVDASVFAEHLFKRGIRELEYQQDPEGVIWARMEDGRLVGLTVEPDQDINAAHEHIIGGTFRGGHAVVESMCVTPGQIIGSDQDILWLIVRRTINGLDRRYIEYVLPVYEPNIGFEASEFERVRAAETARFVDSSLTLYNPVRVLSVVQAADVASVTTATAHGLTVGDTVRFRNMGEQLREEVTGNVVFTSLGVMEYQVLRVAAVGSSTQFSVSHLNATGFDIDGVDGFNPDAPVFSDPQGLATVAKQLTTVSGLGHLEGETLTGLADGSPFVAVVSGSAITLPRPASRVHVGFGYSTIVTTNRYFGTSRLGSDQGQTRSISRVTGRFQDTIGGEFARGSRPFTWQPIVLTFGDGEDISNAPVPVFTGDLRLSLDSSWDEDPVITFRQTEPFPMTLLALFPEVASAGDD